MALPSPAPAHRRIDAIAATAGVVLAAATAAVVTHPPLFGLSPAFGPVADRGAAAVVAAGGFATLVGVVGGAVLLCGYVGGWPRVGLGRRAAGWAVLAAAAAAGFDVVGPGAGMPPGTVYGPGGAVGAFLGITAAAAVSPVTGAGILAAAAFLGLWLAADGVVRVVGRAGGRVAVAGWAVVRKVAARGVSHARGFAARRPVAILAVPEVPVTASVEIPLAEIPILNAAAAAVEEVELMPAPIPIRPPVPVDRPVKTTPIPIDRPVSLPVAAPPPTHDAFELPPLSLLTDADAFPVADHESALRERAVLLEKTFLDFGLTVKVVGIHTGPVITQYEVALETGLRLNRVTTLADDLALNLRVSSVRVVAPLPGRNTVGIELPNEHRQTVRLKELIAGTTEKAAKFKLPIFLGKDVEGRPLAYDLAAMPHLLIAGRTGTGKSVCLNSIILSLLFTRNPDDCRMILIDPKKVELSEYGKVPHLMHPVVTDSKKAEAILAWAVDKMEDRYEWLRRARVRNVAAFNDLPFEEVVRRVNPENEDERLQIPRRMPYVVIVIDEVGDLLMEMKKEVESHIIRLAQKSRAAGIHLILATQKPTVDVITGLIKSNLPARVCFQVASRADSMVVLDEKGADKLLGMGDMLFLQPGTSSILRAQGAYVSDEEIEKTVSHLETDEPNYESELLNLKAKDAGGKESNLGEKLRERDAMYEQAVEIVIREQRGSTSLLQRALGVGYGRASRLIDFMAEDGIVGGFNGSNAREVLVTPEDWSARRAG